MVDLPKSKILRQILSTLTDYHAHPPIIIELDIFNRHLTKLNELQVRHGDFEDLYLMDSTIMQNQHLSAKYMHAFQGNIL